MATPPAAPRAIAFFDGQNLFHAAKDSFGYTFPNFDPLKLASSVCSQQGWDLIGCNFYTGVPDRGDDSFWSDFWSAKLLSMSRQGIKTFSRPLKYRNNRVKLPDGTTYSFLVGAEKGIDVRIAIDVVSSSIDAQADVMLIFSQDQDLSEVADEIRSIATQQKRWIKIACAYPDSPASRNHRGINKTDWIKIDRTTYDACIDPRNYATPRHP